MDLGRSLESSRAARNHTLINSKNKQIKKKDTLINTLTHKISSQEVISNGAVQAFLLKRIGQVSGFGCLNKLTVIPARDLGAISPPVHQV